MITPVTSTKVETKGADDVAGSTPIRLKIKGRRAPDKVPHNTTPINDKPMVIAIINQ